MQSDIYYAQVRNSNGTVTLVPDPDFVPADPDFAEAIAADNLDVYETLLDLDTISIPPDLKYYRDRWRQKGWPDPRTPAEKAADDAADEALYAKCQRRYEADLAKFIDTLQFKESKMPVVPFPVPPTQSEAPKAEPLGLTFFNECRDRAPKKHIIKGVIAKGESSSTYGAPGSLKSAFKLDMMVHAAAGRNWRGFRTKEKCGGVYYAFERADLVRRRLAAYAIRDGFKDLPIAVCDKLIDMVDVGCVDIIIATIRAAEAHFGIPVGFIAFDTWSKGIAAGGGDEDKALYQNAVAANLKRIHEQADVHIAGVGHSGKDTTRGERGSNARQGDVDVQIQITGNSVKTATVVKANDQPDGPLTSFAAETVALGTDEDGEPISTVILSAAPCQSVPARSGKLTELQQLALDALDKTVAAQGGPVTIEVWRDEMYRNGTLDREAKNPRADFKRLKLALIVAKRLVEQNGFVQKPDVGMPPFPEPRTG